jgi:hypothetical protein
VYNCSALPHYSEGYGIVKIENGPLTLRNFNFSHCLQPVVQGKGAVVVEYANDRQTDYAIIVPVSCFVTSWKCSGQYHTEYGFF